MTARAHTASCRWHANRAAVECTCGAITDLDILRAQLLGHPLPEPKAHAQFKRLPPPAAGASA